MTQALHIKDEHDEGTIHPGQCFDIVFWGAESAVAFGRLSETNTIEVYVLDETTFDRSDMEVSEFLEIAGFNYCDLVILHIYPTDLSIEDVKATLTTNN